MRRRPPGGARPAPAAPAGFDALAEVLLSQDPTAPAPAPDPAHAFPPESPAPGDASDLPLATQAAPQEGLIVCLTGGLEPALRRQAALATAARLAPHSGGAAVILLEGGRADVHRAEGNGEAGAAAPAAGLAALLASAARVLVAPLGGGGATGLARRAPPGARPVVLAQPDAESLLEAYRELKAWHQARGPGPMGLVALGAEPTEAARLHGRLRAAAAHFLESDLGLDAVLTGRAEPPPPCVLAGVPEADVWAALAGGPAERLTPPRPAATVTPTRGEVPMARPSWDAYFMAIADMVARRSTCLRRQIGAVLVVERRILATGYNGAPAGVAHCEDVGCLRQQQNVPSGERHELCRGLHAEQNAIIQAAKHGVRIAGATLYTTHHPCSACAKMAINAGVARVVCREDYPDDLGKALLAEEQVAVDVVPAEGA